MHYYLFLLPVIFLSFFAGSLEAQISGKVFDEMGEPLPFASVYLQNSTKGTTANVEGEYRLALEKGTYQIIFQYVGFKQHIETVTVKDRPITLNVKMEPNALEVGEVTIMANAEDPAYAIMRNAIAQRKYFKKSIQQYTCDTYIKGLYRIAEAPKKIMGQKVGNMEGLLDSTGKGILYLSESVSKLYIQSDPARKKEVMVSSKVSGNPNGFSLNRSTLTDFSLYDEYINIDRNILSPLADNAFTYYRFKLLGRFNDETGHNIAKIAVIPKNAEDAVFGGVIYVVDQQWNIQGADLFLTGQAMNQPVLDTLQITQQYVPLGAPEKWTLLSQVLTFRFKVFGFKINGFFNSVFSNYDLQPNFTPNFFNQEVFKIADSAALQQQAYWESTRPIPLTVEETNDYIKKDSLHLLVSSKPYMDSVDRASNKFKLSNALFGYTYNKSYQHFSASVPSILRNVQFNTVQGWLLALEPQMRKKADERGTRYWEIDSHISYGLAEQKLRAEASLERRFNSIHYNTLRISGGQTAEQFNDNQPIRPFVNSFYTLVLKKNYLKLYEKTFGKLAYSQELRNGFFFFGNVEYASRRELTNQTNYSWNKDDQKSYTANNPLEAQYPTPLFAPHQAFIMDVAFRFKFRQKYLSMPGYRQYEDSKYPVVSVRYRKAIPGVVGSDMDYDVVLAQAKQTDISFGLLGSSRWSITGGTFFNNKRTEFMDFRHILGNQTIIGKSSEYSSSFFLLPFYAFSTNASFVQANYQHHFDGFFLDKIPLLRKLNWKEVVGISTYYTDKPVLNPEADQKLPYWEINWGFENIGYRVFRMFRIDIATGFFGKNYYRTGFVIGIDF